MSRDPDAAPAFDLASRPGFLIRRLHQIHLALFLEECAGFDVTPVQYSIMSAVLAHPHLEQARSYLEQARLGEIVGVDRATVANVLARLEGRGLIRRIASPTDKRLKLIHLTAAGQTLLGHMDAPARRAHERTLEALAKPERDAFSHALTVLVEAGNAFSRAPLRPG